MLKTGRTSRQLRRNVDRDARSGRPALRESGRTRAVFWQTQPDTYADCFARLKLREAEIVAVGDSLLHDIAGARGVRIDALFIADASIRMKLELKTAGHSQVNVSKLCRPAALRDQISPWSDLSGQLTGFRKPVGAT